jgi:hypothetical protein
MRIIGLSGYAQSGKDTAAEALLDLGYERVAFADILRDCVYAQDHPVFWNAITEETMGVQEIVDQLGWTQAKLQFPVIRRSLQRFGTEVGRNILGENIWVDATFARLNPDGKYAITDCRFPNEADAIKAKGGWTVRITRKGLGPLNQHASETSLDRYKFDFSIVNDGTKEEFQQLVRKLERAIP